MTRPLQLSRLRAIGWTLWDPIGLAEDGGEPPDGAADEYDAYLVKAAGLLRRGATEGQAAAWLQEAAAGMGLPHPSAEAAARTAAALRDYLEEIGG